MMGQRIGENDTIGEVYGPAMQITSQQEADDYFSSLVDRHLRRSPGTSRQEAEKIERQNLGYYAGYYDVETRLRVEGLFRCAHPFFGNVAHKGSPTPEEAFEMGKRFGKKLRKKNEG